MRALAAALLVLAALAACGSSGGNDDDGDDGAIDAAGPCVGLECAQVECPNGGTTSVSGIVYAPNGWLPLYNVTVYVPNGPVDALLDGAVCDRCDQALSGNPLVEAVTLQDGSFTIPDMPATADVPLVIQVGKWRRQITIPSVAACSDTPLPAAQTRLPANRSEGDIPKMALTTGGADALECLLRKIGLDDSEFTTLGGAGRVHLFAGNAVTSGGGTDELDPALGGSVFGQATNLWASQDTLDDYDVVLLSCEGDQNTADKPAAARDAMKGYADLGGRIFASHWHNYWIQAADPPWSSVITYNNTLGALGSVTADVNRDFEKGEALAKWLVNVQGSTSLGRIDLRDAKNQITAVDETRADKWIYLDTTANGTSSVQYLSFTTPLEVVPDERCGRVVLSDIHVTGGPGGDLSNAGITFPSGGCTSSVDVLTPQEKVLAFMLFDIASCVGPVVE